MGDSRQAGRREGGGELNLPTPTLSTYTPIPLAPWPAPPSSPPHHAQGLFNFILHIAGDLNVVQLVVGGFMDGCCEGKKMHLSAEGQQARQSDEERDKERVHGSRATACHSSRHRIQARRYLLASTRQLCD